MNNKKNLIIVLTISLVVYLVLNVGLFCYWRMWFSTTWAHEVWASFGTFTAGTLGVLLSAVNVIILIYIWKEQKLQMIKDNTEKDKEIEAQKIEARFFELFKIRIEIRNEIKVKGHNLLQDTENEVIGNAQLSILSGNDAIYAISKEISETYKNLSTSLEKRREIYYRHSNYLRHFFDFTLTMLEYIDTRKVLNQKQKQEYVDLVVESASYDESMLWVLLQTDYDESKRKTKPQIDRLNDLDLKYDIMRRLVFQEVNENNEVIK